MPVKIKVAINNWNHQRGNGLSYSSIPSYTWPVVRFSGSLSSRTATLRLASKIHSNNARLIRVKLIIHRLQKVLIVSSALLHHRLIAVHSYRRPWGSRQPHFV